MRAAYANGVLAAFEDAGFIDFDAVYGTSAGGALAAWFSARQARYAADTWEYAQDARIMSYRRWITRRGPLLDHDGLFEIVYEKEMPLDVAAVQNAPHPVIVTVTDPLTAETHYPDIRQGPVLPWLRATGRLPLATGPAVEIDGRKWVDGGVTDPVPLAKAIEDGATDVTLILNRPPGMRDPEPAYVIALVRRRYPAIADAIADHHGHHNRAIALAENPPAGVTVRIVRPSAPTGVGRLTRDVDRLRHAIHQGEADGRAFLAQSPSAPPA